MSHKERSLRSNPYIHYEISCNNILVNYNLLLNHLKLRIDSILHISFPNTLVNIAQMQAFKVAVSYCKIYVYV